MIGKISGTGSYVPSRYLDNHNLSQIVEADVRKENEERVKE